MCFCYIRRKKKALKERGYNNTCINCIFEENIAKITENIRITISNCKLKFWLIWTESKNYTGNRNMSKTIEHNSVHQPTSQTWMTTCRPH